MCAGMSLNVRRKRGRCNAKFSRVVRQSGAGRLVWIGGLRGGPVFERMRGASTSGSDRHPSLGRGFPDL